MTGATTIPERMQLAMELHRAGQLAEARALYTAIVGEDPRQTNAAHNLGMILLTLGEYVAALRLLRRTLAIDADNPGWRESLPQIGWALYQHGHWEAALPWLEAALLARPDDAQIATALERICPRDYLAAEIIDPLTNRTLIRYAPRESATYVYAIEVSGGCNLRCPTCPVGNSPASPRPRGFMPVPLFRRILDKITTEAVTRTPDIFLFNWGEPLLHPAIAEIVTMVRSAGYGCHLSSNLNIERSFDSVIKADPSSLKISLSGFDQDTYGSTHARGSLALVKSNMIRLRYCLDKYRAGTRVWVGQHLYRSNLHQVEEVASFCRELGFEHHPIAAFFQPQERLIEVLDQRADFPILADFLEHPRSYVPRLQASKSQRHDCELRFNQTAINVDGSVALCCNVFEPENMLGVDFLGHSHEHLEELKYRHPNCRVCMKHGLHYAPTDLSVADDLLLPGHGP